VLVSADVSAARRAAGLPVAGACGIDVREFAVLNVGKRDQLQFVAAARRVGLHIEKKKLCLSGQGRQVGAELVANQICPWNSILVVEESIGLGRRRALNSYARMKKCFVPDFVTITVSPRLFPIGGREAANLVLNSWTASTGMAACV